MGRLLAWLSIAPVAGLACSSVLVMDASTEGAAASPGGAGGSASDGGSATVGGGGDGGVQGAPECDVPSDCGTDTDCRTYACTGGNCSSEAVALGAPCDDDGGAFCDGRGQCVAAAGQPCTAHDQCASEHCIDAVCCDTDCNGGVLDDCMACDLGGMVGTCSAEPAATACGGGGTCDVLGRCWECLPAYADDFQKPDGDLAGELLTVPQSTSWFRGGISNLFSIVNGADLRAVDEGPTPYGSAYLAPMASALPYANLRLRLSFTLHGTLEGNSFAAVYVDTENSGTEVSGIGVAYSAIGNNGSLLLQDLDEYAEVTNLNGLLSAETPYFLEADVDALKVGRAALTSGTYAHLGGATIATVTCTFTTETQNTYVTVRSTAEGLVAPSIHELSVETCVVTP
jgi:hypothetical protein